MSIQLTYSSTTLALLISAVFLASPASLLAKSTVIPIQDVNYSTQASLADNLKSLLGKRITVSIVSGKTITGSILAVGEHLLHLERLQGKEYYDALIRIDSIHAVETRFRMIQR